MKTTTKLSMACLAALMLALVAAPAKAQDSGPIYVVETGDTLSGIAVRFGTTVAELSVVNQIADPNRLLPGTELVIPGFEGISGTLLTLNVTFGETPSSLSLRHGISFDTLIRLNRIVNPARIYLGQLVVVLQDGDGTLALPESRLVLPDPNQSLLELAVREGLNPWVLTAYSHGADRGWRLPGEPLVLKEEGRTTTAIPEPILSVRLQPYPAVQGHTSGIYVETSQPVLLEGFLGIWSLDFHPLDTSHVVALQGIHAMAEPGVYDLELQLQDQDGGEVAYVLFQPIRVIEGGFAYDPVLIVPPETLDPEAIDPENQVMSTVVAAATPERLWEGVFEFPALYTKAFPSVFGSRRNYNNQGYTTYHSGLDFYGSEGDPIFAPAPGRVVLVQTQIVRGKTTVIDHGWGVYTVYVHQSDILVEVGDFVETGQKIGEVGATGRVTGAHLHWEVVVGGVPVEPLEWTEIAWP
ncbi:MAG: peptidoglycan DD-metalloendopeptidase family protein [Anaerolineales bacterium]|jgi:murein DD-endopeptidase MepM/ murein hydrolase activator NlpD